jgi:hypothetical protein
MRKQMPGSAFVLLAFALSLSAKEPMALVLAQNGTRLFRETQSGFPLPAYVLHIPGLQVAEMSPDEKYLTALVVHWPNGVPPTAELQVWDFRRGALLQTRSLPAPEARPGYPHGTTNLRHTSDGQLVAVYTGGDLLHVLRVTDLEEVQTVQIQSHANINAFEVSPTSHRIAMCMSGDVRVYDLDSGEEIRSWKITSHSEFKMPELLQVHWQLDTAGLAWRGDGGALAISVADNPPCLRGGGTIYIFDITSNQGPKTFRVPLLSASVAFGTGNNLYVASNTCGGYLTHWTLDLPIFDSASGREKGKIQAGRVGFRGYMAISANKQILLAHADREKTTFAGGEDSLSITDEQWQVWDLSAGKLVLILPVTGRVSVGNYPSLSYSGHFVCADRAQDLEIYALPMAEK